MSSRVYLNGDLVPKLDARLSVYDHGLLYGDGVWEGMRLYGGVVFRLAEHLRNLRDSAAALGFALPFSIEDLQKAVAVAIAGNARREGYIRVIVTRGPGTIGLDPRKCDPQLVILVDDVVPFPAELYSHGLHAITAARIRLDPANPLHRARSLSHGHMVLAKSEALEGGCLESILLSTSGQAVGCTEGHLFAVKEGCLRTPPRDAPFPFDVVRDEVIALAEKQNRRTEEADLAPAELLLAEELFLAGTAPGVIGIVRLDGQPIGAGSEGPVTRAVRENFKRLTRGPTE